MTRLTGPIALLLAGCTTVNVNDDNPARYESDLPIDTSSDESSDGDTTDDTEPETPATDEEETEPQSSETVTPEETETPSRPPTDGDTAVHTGPDTPTASGGETETPVATNGERPSETVSPAATGTATEPVTEIATASATATETATVTATASPTETATQSATGTASVTETATTTATASATPTETASASATATETATATASTTATATASASASASESETETETETATASATATATASASASESDVYIPSGSLLHRWRFNNSSLVDEVGGSNATVVNPDGQPGGSATYSASQITLPGGLYGEADYIDLGANLLQTINGPLTIELFATVHTVQTWARIFELGSGTSEYLLMTWCINDDGSQSRVRWWDTEFVTADITTAPYTLNQEYHIVMTVAPGSPMQIVFYTAPSASGTLGSAKASISTNDPLGGLNDADDWLGRSHSSNDDTANASYNDVRIWSGVLSATDRELLHDLGPNADLGF